MSRYTELEAATEEVRTARTVVSRYTELEAAAEEVRTARTVVDDTSAKLDAAADAHRGNLLELRRASAKYHAALEALNPGVLSIAVGGSA